MATTTETTIERPVPTGTPPHRVIRVSWKVFGGLFAVGMLTFGVYQLVGVLAHEEVTVSRAFDAAALNAVEIDNGADGRVTVVGSDTDQVRVRAEVSHGLRRTGHSEQVVGGTLMLDSTCPILGSTWCTVDYTVEVPHRLAVLVRVDSGSVDISDVAGDVDVQADSNGIDLARLSGQVRARSDSGSVEATELRSSQVDASSDSSSVRLEFADSPMRVSARSDSGSVEVVVPDDRAEYNVVADSDSGAVNNSVLLDSASARYIEATSDSSSVTIRYAG